MVNPLLYYVAGLFHRRVEFVRQNMRFLAMTPTRIRFPLGGRDLVGCEYATNQTVASISDCPQLDFSGSSALHADVVLCLVMSCYRRCTTPPIPDPQHSQITDTS
jgi:hypothetical protein